MRRFLVILICCSAFLFSLTGQNRENLLIDNFESGDYSAWIVDGKAFGLVPAQGSLSGQQEVVGYEGAYLVNSFNGGDQTTGMLMSLPFLIKRTHITFLLGGGANNGCRIELLIGNDVLYSTTPDVSEELLKWYCWDVSGFQGDSARIRIVDEATNGWGHICVDNIVQSDNWVIESFEHGYLGWTILGEAFGTEPASGKFPGQNDVRGYNGLYYVNTFKGGDNPIGRMQSQSFVISMPYINFRIGGGFDRNLLHVDLYIGKQKVLSSTPINYLERANDSEQEKLRCRTWNVSQWIGDSAFIVIVDSASGDWGHINVDDFIFSMEPSSYAKDNYEISRMVTGKYLYIPAQNWSSYTNVSIKDQEGLLVSTQRIRFAHDGIDRYVPLYVGGLIGKNINIHVGEYYANHVYDSYVYFADTLPSLSNSDLYYPNFHFAPSSGWLNDPNGLVYHNGKYHLYYQHYPYDPHWNASHWGHAVSEDLVHWEPMPIALFPDDFGNMFSGSVVVDRNNTAGFGKNAFIALYTTTSPRQAQSLAYSTDEGITWHKYGEPILWNDETYDFRDPKVFWYEPWSCWMMVVAGGYQVICYSSTNLKDWHRELGWGGHVGCHTGVWECPDLVQVPIEGTNEYKWVLLVSVADGAQAGGSGIQYFIGDFVGNDFILATDGVPRWVDFGMDNYAGITWNDVRDELGRPIMIGWMNNWRYCNAIPQPTSSFRGQTTFPRALSLVNTPDGLKLKSSPINTIDLLYCDNLFTKETCVLSNEWMNDSITAMRNGVYMIDLFVAAGKNSWKITLSNQESEFVAVGYNGNTNEVYLDRQHSGITNFSESFAPGNHVATLSGQEQVYRARILVDHSSVEFFINDGRVVLTDLVFPSSPYTTIRLNPEHTDLPLQRLIIRELSTTTKSFTSIDVPSVSLDQQVEDCIEVSVFSISGVCVFTSHNKPINLVKELSKYGIAKGVYMVVCKNKENHRSIERIYL